MSDLVVARNCCMTRMLPGEAELVFWYDWMVLLSAACVQRYEPSQQWT